MRKGQIHQVFIYILTIIVVGLILLIGYKSFGGIMKKGCDVEKATFKSTLESYISKYSSYGSFHMEPLKAPCAYQQICFVSSEKIGDSGFDSSNEIIKSSVKESIKNNIFIVKDVTDAIGFNEKIVVDNTGGIVCINNTNGYFRVNFEGLGRNVSISGVS
ncbi:MAG: hypothetical protein KJ583_02505 [Nanoarchaeota archaeon]|nr:hypothetical protein [Nanoarchaeota archaeon]MBU1269924.1 hypothetical protein [Nanoarchaeota archaeon]MBU1604165.1 hypothetical protein [Nanoarchaeota archaeon]MBU2443066.1 hypothetical protein [Nanoarchaeota archaeon]